MMLAHVIITLEEVKGATKKMKLIIYVIKYMTVTHNKIKEIEQVKTLIIINGRLLSSTLHLR